MPTRPRPRSRCRAGPLGAGAARAGGLLGWVVLATLLALAAVAQEETGGGGEAAPPVELDRLLQLPSSKDYTVERRGGRTAGEWRRRFAELRRALAEERAALADAERRQEELAGSTDAWKVAPNLPGVGAPSTEAPLDYGLRQEIRRHRAEIERLERQLRELEIEADLAGVPAAWQTGAPAPGASQTDEPPAP